MLLNMLMKAKAGAKVVGRAAVANAPKIGFVSTAVMLACIGVSAYKLGRKAQRLVDVAEKEKGEPLTKSEELKVTAKCWAPVAAQVAIGEAANYIGFKTGNERLKAMTSTATALLEKNNDMRNDILNHTLDADNTPVHITEKEDGKKVIELGSRTLTPEEECNIYQTGNGNTLFYDAFTGVLFYSSPQAVLSGIARYQKRWIHSEYGLNIAELYKCWDVVRGGVMLSTARFSKPAKTEFDKYEIPEIDMEFHPYTIENPITGEYEPDQKGHYVIQYFPNSIDADYLLGRDKSFTPIDDLEDDIISSFLA